MKLNYKGIVIETDNVNEASAIISNLTKTNYGDKKKSAISTGVKKLQKKYAKRVPWTSEEISFALANLGDPDLAKRSFLRKRHRASSIHAKKYELKKSRSAQEVL
jgi:hypothetical protein